jgi:hypothetical protein
MQQSTLASRIQREIADQTGLRIVVAEMENTLLLSGRVPTDDDRRRVARIARSLAPERRIDEGLDVERVVAENIEDTVGLNADELSPNEPAQSPPDFSLAGEYDADLHSQPLETDAMDVSDPDNYVNSDQVAPVEPDPTYFAPTDPVIGVGNEGETTVLGGWSPDSMADQEIPASTLDNQPGDEALADAITRELREDASTTQLTIDVQVDRGVARLRGRVTDLTDAENAESVASRVPGVRDVIEELDVSSL